MATPTMLVGSAALSSVSRGKSTVRINTKNPDGTPLDVSSGYTISAARQFPSQDANSGFGLGPDVKTTMSGAFDSTGVTITLDMQALEAVVPTLHTSIELYLSNDGGSTDAVAAIIAVTLDNKAGLLS